MTLKTKIIIAVLVIIATALTIITFSLNQIKKGHEFEISNLKSTIDSLRIKSALFQSRIDADELFISGAYQEAFALYDSIAPKQDQYLVSRRKDVRGRMNAVYSELVSTENQNRVEMGMLKDLMDKGMEEKEIWYRDAKDSMMITHSREVAALKKALADKQMEIDNVPKNLSLTFYSKNGTKTTYFGEVANSKANGIGIGYYSTGNAYIGGWKDNLKHGNKCTYLWVDGDRYEGDYKNDKREGKGSYFWKNGDRYEGDWMDDKRNGFGVLYNYENSIKLKGEWKNDEFAKSIN